MAGTKNRTSSPKTRIVLTALVLSAIVCGSVGMVLYGENGFFHLLRMEREKQSLLETRDEWREKNRELYGQIQRLRSDLGFIEKSARKELGLVRDGELVYIFEPDD